MGNSIEDCRAFKGKVKKLIDNKCLTFKEDNPNIKSNHFLDHSGPSINDVEKCSSSQTIKKKDRGYEDSSDDYSCKIK